jgi:non-specific serine/threonine protein kinase
VAELLTSLVDKSLVMTDERGGATRYGMLETVRQYALDRLQESGEQAQWQARHLASFLALAEEASHTRGGAKGRSLLDEVAREHDNLRAALGWCVATKVPEGLRLAAALGQFWLTRSRHITEAREWDARLLEALPKDIAVYHRAWVLINAADAARYQRDYGAAEALCRQSLTLCREINEPRLEANGLRGLASLALDRGRYAEAEPILLEAIALSRKVGKRELYALNINSLAKVVHARGDTKRAFQAFEEALSVAHDLDNARLVSAILRDRGRVACQEGMVALAEQSLVEALTIAQTQGYAVDIARALETFADLNLAKHAPERAAIIWGASEHLREEIATPIPVNEQADRQRAVGVARTALGDEAFDRSWNEGRAMPLEEVVRHALDVKTMTDP